MICDRIRSFLIDGGVAFKEIDHAPMFTSDEEESITGLPASQGAKSLLLKTSQQKVESFVLAVLPGDEQLDMARVKKEILKASKLSFASEADVNAVLKCTLGKFNWILKPRQYFKTKFC
ncbi:MAG: YbaK/EbsC family protein [Chlamydiota bacterium]